MATERDADTTRVEPDRSSRDFRNRRNAGRSTLGLLIVGALVGVAVVIGTQIGVAATGTNAFCGGACHSMQWVAQEYQQSSHYNNRTGVRASCHDCHIPHRYPELLWYKTKAGVKDAVAEMQGVISTQEKFNKERTRLANHVYDEYHANNSENCRTCHQFTKEIVAKQKDFVQPMHEQFLAGSMTCIDCHKGVAHKAPE